MEEPERRPCGRQQRDIAAVALLDEPVRRALFDHVTAQGAPVGREDAAAAVGVPVHTAKFHLDRLVAGGLLEVEFRRLTGRTGPGAGRPAKLYRRSDQQLSVTLPERDYALVAEVLAAGVERAAVSGEPVLAEVKRVARERGERLGRTAAGQGPRGAVDLLAAHGYEPRERRDGVRLANCPFDVLARQHTALVCEVNQALVAGVLEGAGVTGLCARLAPEPGVCCVRLDKAGG